MHLGFRIASFNSTLGQILSIFFAVVCLGQCLLCE